MFSIWQINCVYPNLLTGSCWAYIFLSSRGLSELNLVVPRMCRVDKSFSKNSTRDSEILLLPIFFWKKNILFLLSTIAYICIFNWIASKKRKGFFNTDSCPSFWIILSLNSCASPPPPLEFPKMAITTSDFFQVKQSAIMAFI